MTRLGPLTTLWRMTIAQTTSWISSRRANITHEKQLDIFLKVST